jgi:putative transposase
MGFSPISLLSEYLNPHNMPFVKIYIHFVWSTKNREPLLNSADLRKKVWEHIKDNAKEKLIFIDTINGYQEHCHCLISLGIDQTISKIMQLIKGESSYWFNKNNLSRNRLEWQDEYFAASVSPSMVEKVRDYIRNQEEHHKTTPFASEVADYLEKFRLQNFKDRSAEGAGWLG